MITRLRAELKLSSIAFEKRFDSRWSRTKDFTIWCQDIFSSNIVVEIASLSWISVESVFSLRPKTRANSARAGAKTRIMNVNFQFI